MLTQVTDTTMLWSDALTSYDISKGGRKFKATIQSISLGEDSNVKSFKAKYNSWLKGVVHAYQSITAIAQEGDWNPGEDEEDDLDALPTTHDLDLKDPEMLKSEQAKALEIGYTSLQASIEELGEEIKREDDGGKTIKCLLRATLLARVLRTIQANQPRYEK